MLNINVTVRDVALNVSRDLTISVDERSFVQELTELLVRKLAWPEKDIDGRPVKYAVRIERSTGSVLLTGDELVSAAGFLNADVIVIGPVFANAPAPSALTGHGMVSESQPFTMTPLKKP